MRHVRLTVEEFLPHYRKHLRANRKPKTVACYEDWIERLILPRFRSTRLDTITTRHVELWHMRMREEHPTQANCALSVLSAMMKLAARWGYITVTPVHGITWAKSNPRGRYLQPEEILRLKAALDHESVSDRAFILVLLYTGARPGEIASAQWEHLTSPSTLELPDTKTGARTIYLSEAAQAALDTLPGLFGPIFPGVNSTALWKRIRRRAKLDGVRLYDLRHSFASAGISAGLTLEAISQLLGHRQPGTTRRYAHLMREAGTTSASKVGAAIEAML